MNRDVKVGDKIAVTMIDGDVVNPAEFRTVVEIDLDKSLMLLDRPVEGNNVVEHDSWMYNDDWVIVDESPTHSQYDEEETLQHRQAHAYYDDEALSPSYSDAVKAGMTFAEYTGVNITEETLDFEPKEEEVLRGITAESLNFEEAPKSDAVNHPSHYGKGRFETIEMIEEITKGYDNGFVAHCVGTAVKYESRAPFKHDTPLEDLRKARKYLEFAIEHLERMEGK